MTTTMTMLSNMLNLANNATQSHVIYYVQLSVTLFNRATIIQSRGHLVGSM